MLTYHSLDKAGNLSFAEVQQTFIKQQPITTAYREELAPFYYEQIFKRGATHKLLKLFTAQFGGVDINRPTYVAG